MQSEDSWKLDDTMVVRCRGKTYYLLGLKTILSLNYRLYALCVTSFHNLLI